MENKNPLVFYSSPLSLKKIASSCIAIHLWADKISNGTFAHMFHDTWRKFSFDNTLPIPQILVLSIDQAIVVTLKEIKVWVSFFASRIFHRERLALDMLRKHFDQIVWHPNGTIDDVQTAKNMLQWSELSVFHKLRIACTYCFVEDIQTLRPLLSSGTELAGITFEEDPLLYYWEHRYRDQLEGVENLDLRLRAIRIINNRKVDRWAAIEYLYDQTKGIEQLNLCSLIIAQEKAYNNVEKLLRKLNETQLSFVISRYGSDVMMVFLSYPENCQIALQTWNYFKDRIDQNQFYKLIKWIIETESSHSNRLNEELVSAFCEIWAKASDQLKQYVFSCIQRNPSLFVYQINNLKMLPRNIKFLIRVLSDASYNIRNHIWITQWPRLIRGTRPIYLHDFLKICLPEEEIENFKKNQMVESEYIKEYCRDLIRQRCYKELDAYFSFCSQDRRKILRVKQNTILEFFSKENEYSLNELIEIIRSVFKVMDFNVSDYEQINIRAIDDDSVDNNHRRNNEIDSRQNSNFLSRLFRWLLRHCCFSVG